MTRTYKVLGAVAATLIIATVALAGYASMSGRVYGLSGVNDFKAGSLWQAAGLYVGSNQDFSVDSTGVITTTGALTSGGGVRATSTTGNAVPLVATDFDTENVIDVTLNVLDATLSFPATSTLTSFIPTAGQTRTLYVRNASTSAAMDLTISGGTGVLLKKATSTAVIQGDTDGANFARIDLIRKSNTDIEALLSIFID